MMGIGFPELMIILVIIMIIFGAGKLPEIGSAFGNSIKNFKKSMKDAETEELESGSPEGEPALPDSGTTVEAASKTLTPEEAAAKKEAEMIDEVADGILKNRVDPIRTAHDGLVQQNDVFTNSLRSTPGGRGRDRGTSRDVF
ncbi:MAG TPA: twin-arginine translocase TatA/TatE family subunit [Nitrospinaceae bacterium]|jgi:TatA/E family protein of Tat protein translocase|nr:twin-arginine translocase TatA/TatE family subunit [Nitrospinaceae bacterium]HIO24014.1 twin-arginine translocase TatA/TatE family subunit [Nitrospinaceae bacterium]|tara:strand:+ start:984 stop:1409 length:426 start_codon:yes stop_codon:yes gene_type:complete